LVPQHCHTDDISETEKVQTLLCFMLHWLRCSFVADTNRFSLAELTCSCVIAES
jgi:hypothetical protein